MDRVDIQVLHRAGLGRSCDNKILRQLAKCRWLSREDRAESAGSDRAGL